MRLKIPVFLKISGFFYDASLSDQERTRNNGKVNGSLHDSLDDQQYQNQNDNYENNTFCNSKFLK